MLAHRSTGLEGRCSEAADAAPADGDLERLIVSFGRHLRAANRSPGTIEKYLLAARRFAAFCAATTGPPLPPPLRGLLRADAPAPRTVRRLPRLREFYGIVVYMYWQDHQPPHFHAIYGGEEALVRIDDAAFLAGSLPRTAARLVREWAELRRSELQDNWDRAQAPTKLVPIEPLR